MLTDTHFPATQEDLHEWIDPDLVHKAMEQFKPNKAAGSQRSDIHRIQIPAAERYWHDGSYLQGLHLLWAPGLSFFPCQANQHMRFRSCTDPHHSRTFSSRLSNFLSLREWRKIWKTSQKVWALKVQSPTQWTTEFLFDKHHCLGVFLDISSGFDSILIDHVKKRLLEHNGTLDMIEWYHSYLGRCYLAVDIMANGYSL